MSRYEPLIWLALSVFGLYVLRSINRRGFNLYNPVLPDKERRRRNMRFGLCIAVYVAVVLISFFSKYLDSV